MHRRAPGPVIRLLFIITGSVSLALGILGIVLPLLPTTPFLLLSSYLYLRSSQRLYFWLINHRLLGSYIYNYMTYRAVSLRAKIFAVTILWATLLFSMTLVGNLWIILLLFGIGAAVTTHLLLLKTLSREQRIQLYNQRNSDSI